MQRLQKLSVILPFLMNLQGCQTECSGAACGDLYSTAHLSFFDTAGLLAAEAQLFPKDAENSFDGDPSAGRDWSLLFGETGLLAGQPDQSKLSLLSATGETTASLYSLDSDDFGASITRLGSTLIIGAPRHTPGTSGADGGAVYFYDGLAAGWSGDLSITDASQSLIGNAGERLGNLLVPCGDVDADGGDDLLISAEWGNSAGTLSGDVFLLPSQLLAAGSMSRSGLTALSGLTEMPGGKFGQAMACGRPIGTADTTPDLVISAPYAANGAIQGTGAIYFWQGKATVATDAPSFSLHGKAAGDYYGYSLAVGDLDGDGRSDLAVGAIGTDATNVDGKSLNVPGMAGTVYIYMNDRLSQADNFGFPTSTIAPNYILQVPYPSLQNCGKNLPDLDTCNNALLAHFGSALEMSDLDGDDKDELLIGASGFSTDGIYSAGKLWIMKGPPASWVPPLPAPPETRLVDPDSGAARIIVGATIFQQVGRIFATGELEGSPQLALLTRIKTP